MSDTSGRDYTEAFAEGRRRRLVIFAIGGGIVAIGGGVLWFAIPRHAGNLTVVGSCILFAGVIVSFFGNIWYCPACHAEFQTSEWSPNFCRQCGVVLQRRGTVSSQRESIAAQTTGEPSGSDAVEFPILPPDDGQAYAEGEVSPVQPLWRVMRLDDNGNHFVVAPALSRAAALAMIAQFEESAHKQHYWFEPDSGSPEGSG